MYTILINVSYLLEVVAILVIGNCLKKRVHRYLLFSAYKLKNVHDAFWVKKDLAATGLVVIFIVPVAISLYWTGYRVYYSFLLGVVALALTNISYAIPIFLAYREKQSEVSNHSSTTDNDSSVSMKAKADTDGEVVLEYLCPIDLCLIRYCWL